MRAFLHKSATPLTAALFTISAISGVALFLHVGDGVFHEMHEWLSVALLIPFALHLWKNWGALVGYVRRGMLVIPAVATLVVAGLFALPSLSIGGSGGEPPFRAMDVMTRARLADLAPVLDTTPDGLLAHLRAQGYAVSSTAQSLVTIAAASGVPAQRLLVGLLPAR